MYGETSPVVSRNIIQRRNRHVKCLPAGFGDYLDEIQRPKPAVSLIARQW